MGMRLKLGFIELFDGTDQNVFRGHLIRRLRRHLLPLEKAMREATFEEKARVSSLWQHIMDRYAVSL